MLANFNTACSKFSNDFQAPLINMFQFYMFETCLKSYNRYIQTIRRSRQGALALSGLISIWSGRDKGAWLKNWPQMYSENTNAVCYEGLAQWLLLSSSSSKPQCQGVSLNVLGLCCYLVNRAESPWSEDFDFLKFGLFQDTQQGLVWRLPAWCQRLNQLRNKNPISSSPSGRHISGVSK